MNLVTCDLFLMWPPGAGGNFILSLYTWNSMDKIPVNNTPTNIFDAQPFPMVPAQLDTLADKDILNERNIICAHNVHDYYVDNYNFNCYKAWAIVPDDLDTWEYLVKLANLKQNVNMKIKESSMQRYLNNVNKMSAKIDNLQKFNYNDIFRERTVFTKWNDSIKQYHEKNVELV